MDDERRAKSAVYSSANFKYRLQLRNRSTKHISPHGHEPLCSCREGSYLQLARDGDALSRGSIHPCAEPGARSALITELGLFADRSLRSLLIKHQIYRNFLRNGAKRYAH